MASSAPLGLASGLARRWLAPAPGCTVTANITGGGGAGGGYSARPVVGGPAASFSVTFFLPPGAALLAWAANATFPPYGSSTHAGAGFVGTGVMRIQIRRASARAARASCCSELATKPA